MTVTLKEMNEQRNALAAQIQGLADRQAEWTAEDRSTWDQVNSDYDALMADLESRQLEDEIQNRLTGIQHDEARATERSRGEGFFRAPGAAPASQEDHVLAMQAWLCNSNGLAVAERNQQAARRIGVDFERSFLDVSLQLRSPGEGWGLFCARGGGIAWSEYSSKRDVLQRSMDSITATSGAELVPELFSYEYEKALLAYGGLRRIARTFPTASGATLKWPTVDDTGNVASIVGEGQDVGADTGFTTGEVTFESFKYSSLPCLVTQELIEDSPFNIAALVGQLLGERIGRGQAVHFATGSGTGQPQGVVTGSTLGATAASATAIIGDELIALQHSLDPAYATLPSVGWAMNNTTLGAVRMLKSVDNQYIWQPGLSALQPDLLLGKPYAVIQEIADPAANTKPIVYGAFEKFVVRDVATVRFYRLDELYRANDQTGFLALHRSDSRVLNGAALKHLVMAAAV